MNFKLLLTTSLIGLITFSCIKKEGLDREADIISISIEDEGFLTPLINEHTGQISLVVEGAEGNISAYKNGYITPKIEVSRNATVSPASEERVQLSDYKKIYTVTAEDGGEKRYVVSVIKYNPLVQDFEDWLWVNANSEKPYQIPADPMWVNANQGVSMLYTVNTPFPTRSINEKRPWSLGQKSVLLETVRGHRDSKVGLMDIPVYAGNMYRGEFAIGQAMIDPLSTTKFGQPHPSYLGKPLMLVAYYKYKSGTPYLSYEGGVKDIKNVKEDPDRKDKPDIYAILFKVPKGKDGKKVFLTAKDVKTSSRIVATAILEDTSEKLDWVELKLKFNYLEEVDFENFDYKLTVVLSSSTDGAMYQGAVGSRLIVDDLRVVCENDDDKDEFLK